MCPLTATRVRLDTLNFQVSQTLANAKSYIFPVCNRLAAISYLKNVFEMRIPIALVGGGGKGMTELGREITSVF